LGYRASIVQILANLDDWKPSFLGFRNSPAIYLKKLAFLIRIKMRGQASLNSLNTAPSAHFWPHLRRENCEALRIFLGFRNSPAIYLKKLAFLIRIKMRGQASLNSLSLNPGTVRVSTANSKATVILSRCAIFRPATAEFRIIPSAEFLVDGVLLVT
jgi:hypothetical protein